MGAFGSRENATRIATKLRVGDTPVQIHERARQGKPPLHFVIAGCFKGRAEALQLAERLSQAGTESFVTRASIAKLGPLVETGAP